MATNDPRSNGALGLDNKHATVRQDRVFVGISRETLANHRPDSDNPSQFNTESDLKMPWTRLIESIGVECG